MTLFTQYTELRRLFESLMQEIWWNDYRHLVIYDLSQRPDDNILMGDMLGDGDGNAFYFKITSGRTWSLMQFFHGGKPISHRDATDLLLDPVTHLYAGNPRRALVQIVSNVQKNICLMRDAAGKANDPYVLKHIIDFEMTYFPHMAELLLAYQSAPWQSYSRFTWFRLKLQLAIFGE